MPEILPASANGVEETIIETTTPEFGTQEVREFTGPTAALEEYRDYYLQGTGTGGNVGS
jgi:hypothetical protein